MKIGLIAMGGIRVVNPELRQLGLTLPGFVERGEIIASLPSLGLLTVAAHTPAENVVSYKEVDDLPEELPEFDLVAISSLAARIYDAYELADRFRHRGALVVMGGLHVSVLPDEAAKHCDAVVIGNAEKVWGNCCGMLNQGGWGRGMWGMPTEYFARRIECRHFICWPIAITTG